MRTRGPAALLAAAALGTMLLASCGAPGSTRPAEIDSADVPYELLSPSPKPPSTAAPPEILELGVTTPVYLLGTTGMLRPAPTPVAPGSPARIAGQALMRLQTGPTDDERAAGLSSALGAAVRLTLVAIDNGTARVEVRLTGGDLAADRVPFALGQVVLTLTSVAGIDGVQLVSAGALVEMALPGGVRTTEPVTASDYAVLVEPAP